MIMKTLIITTLFSILVLNSFAQNYQPEREERPVKKSYGRGYDPQKERVNFPISRTI